MERVVTPVQGLRGEIRVPSDRSVTVRALLFAAIARGVSRIRAPLMADDTKAALDVVRCLGVHVREDAEDGSVIVNGRGLLRLAPRAMAEIAPGLRGVTLHCGGSGTTARLLAGMMAGQPFASRIDGDAQLRRRPMERLIAPLGALGAAVQHSGGRLPLLVRPSVLHGGAVSLPIASAQVASAVLLAGLYTGQDVTVTMPEPVRDHTPRLLAAMGARARWHDGEQALMAGSGPLIPLDLRVPGDFSSAAFLLVAGTLLPGGPTLLDVGVNPSRTGLLDVLAAMGAPVLVAPSSGFEPEPTAHLTPQHAALRGVTIALPLSANLMDELPVIAVAATQAAGTTTVRGAGELRVKESDRIRAVVGELRKLGAAIEERPDGFVVEGPRPLTGAVVDAHGDHRIAMALAVAGLIARGETTIRGGESVAKTYPEFWADLTRLM